MSDDLERVERALARSVAPQAREGVVERRQGVIDAVNASGTVDVVVGDVIIPGMRYKAWYTPVVNDVVFVEVVGTDFVVDGPLERTSSPGAMVEYTPSWSGTLGNGTLTGRYRLSGKLVHFTILLIWGTTTSHGGGAQLFGLPFAPRITNAFVSVGTATLEDVGTSLYDRTVSIQTGGGSLMVHRDNVSINNVVPFTWGNTDRSLLNGAYERA